jgi:long-chain acyl-CoA synthetase
MEPKTIQELVHYIGIFGRKTAAQIKNDRDDYDRYSFDEYQRTAKAVAGYLERSRHLRKEDMVVIYSDNRPEWMMAYLGIVYNGLWAVPLDAKLTDLEVKNLLTDCGAKVMFVSKSLYDNLSSEPEVMQQIQEFIIFDEIHGIHDRKVRRFRDIVDEGKKIDVKDHPVTEDDVASLIYTSGTTGSPKGVLLTHRNFSHQFRALSRSVPITVEDTELCLLPLHHTFEFSVQLTCLYCGATITYAESLRPNKMLANIRETGVTIMIGVPLIFEKLYEGIMRNIRALSFPLKPFVMGLFYFTGGLNKVTGNAAGKRIFGFLRKKAGLDGVKYMISGAAPLNYKVAAGFDTLGLTLLNGYGLTESSPVIAVNRLDRKIKNESVGIPIPGVEVKIDNPDSDGQGEILTRSASVMKGYFRNPKATAEVIDSENWLHTGDIGTLDAEGYLHVTGRKKNIIVTPGGKNVYPEEIEDKLTESPFILEALIVGIPEAEHSKGETIYCYVVPNYEYFDNYCSVNGHKLTDEFVEQTVDQAVREVSVQLADYKKIKGWRIRREEFQKTSTKKIKRYLFSGKDFINS